MLSKIETASISGMDVEKVTVETDFSQGLPCLSLVGLPDATVRESKERIRSAIINSGYIFPLKRITVNLSPADTRKTGSHFDLPMAVGILKSMGMFTDQKMEKAAFLGELSLDGKVAMVESCLALVLGLKEQGIRDVYLPAGCTEDFKNIEGIQMFPVESLTGLIDHLADIEELQPIQTGKFNETSNEWMIGCKDYSDVLGQDKNKRAMQISAAGWHDIMMVGPPGAGKTMLASRLDTIMTEPTKEELDEITKIHSIAGESLNAGVKAKARPFRIPHHTATSVALMGGGYNSKPGELSLAHRGILFLDELPEFDRKILDMLRQPLEDGFINLSRLAGRNSYPCNFILVAAMNPCPCGYYGEYSQECICNTMQRTRYIQKVSGPLKDRIDLHIKVRAVDFREVNDRKDKPLSSAQMKEGVLRAAEIQERRYKNENFRSNSQIPDQMMDKYCRTDKVTSRLLTTVSTGMNLSARAVSKVKMVARTIADISGRENIGEEHVAEALGYRTPAGNDLLN